MAFIKQDTANPQIPSAFPPHDVSPEKKASKKWGLQGAMAIWYLNSSLAPNILYNDRDTYTTWLKYAFGEQEDVAKPAFGINAVNETHSFIGGIRWANKNFATKRIQSVASKIFANQYEPVASAIDPVSMERREAFRASMRTWANQQEWLQERAQMLGLDATPEGVDTSMLPTNDEDLEILMQDYKLTNEIALELGIKYHLERLDFRNIKDHIDQYLTMLPIAGAWVGLDENNMPEVKALNPSRIIAPKSEFKDYKRIAYGAYVDEYTVAEFRQMTGTELSNEEKTRLADLYARRGTYHKMRYNMDYPGLDRDVDTIMVMHFEIATVDELVYLEKKDRYGNDRTIKKPHDYYLGKEDKFRSKYKNERKITRLPKPTTYGGYWIVGSDVIFGWGEKNNLRGEIGYKLRASNSLAGHSTCLIKQMKPCLDNLETYDKKIQSLVASAIPKAVKIDLFALRKASFQFKGKDMKIEDLLMLFFQTGIIVVDSSDMGSQGDTRKPIEILAGAGIAEDLGKYLELMRQELEQLDEIIGYNRVSSGATLSPEMANKVALQQQQATDTNLDYLYRADHALCKDIYQALGHLHRESVMMNPEHYVPIFGEEQVMRLISSYHQDELGIDIEALPTQQQWLEFLGSVDVMIKEGHLRPEDKATIKRFKSMKQAEAYIKVVSNRRQREERQHELELIDRNGQVQQQSAMLTADRADQSEMMRRDTEMLIIDRESQNMDKQHRYKMEELALQKGMENQGKVEAAEIAADASIDVAKMRPKPQAK